MVAVPTMQLHGLLGEAYTTDRALSIRAFVEPIANEFGYPEQEQGTC
jgi:hypothetical protein